MREELLLTYLAIFLQLYKKNFAHLWRAKCIGKNIQLSQAV